MVGMLEFGFYVMYCYYQLQPMKREISNNDFRVVYGKDLNSTGPDSVIVKVIQHI